MTGIKPTSLRVSHAGHVALPDRRPPLYVNPALTQIGPIARFVEDLDLVLRLIAGSDPRDPHAVDMPFREPSEVSIKKLRVAFHVHNGIGTVNAEVADVVRAAAKTFADQNVAVEETRPTVLAQAPAILSAVGFTPAPAPSAITQWENYKSSMLKFAEGHDVILCPARGVPAPNHGGARNDSTSERYLLAYNVAGWPAAVVRCGTSRTGLPIGVQIASAPWREAIVLAVAPFLETALGGWQPVPPAQITQTRSGSGLLLRWKGYGTLRSAGSIGGPWTDVPNDNSPFRVSDLGSPDRFYRVRQ